MRREARRLYCVLAVLTVLIVSLPKRGVEAARGYTAALFGPFWNQLTAASVARIGTEKPRRWPPSYDR